MKISKQKCYILMLVTLINLLSLNCFANNIPNMSDETITESIDVLESHENKVIIDTIQESNTLEEANIATEAETDLVDYETISENSENNEEVETFDINEYEQKLIEKYSVDTESPNDEETDITSTDSEIKIANIIISDESLFTSGNHTSEASPSVVIQASYDRHEIYAGDNEGRVKISDNNGTYYDGDMKVRIIRDIVDNNDSPMLLKLANDVTFFNFDKNNDNYVLLPSGFISKMMNEQINNGFLNPQGINALDHIEVSLKYNNADLGKYDLYEYGILYYLSCYEGVMGEYYYYNPESTDIESAVSFYINNKIMNRSFNITPEYFYRRKSGDRTSFKPTWVINSNNLTGNDKEKYIMQWINFPYFIIKSGEKYWNLKEMIEESTYLSEYLEGYYEQYDNGSPFEDLADRLIVLDEVYKTEENAIADTTNKQTVHPYVKSDKIVISGNYREDKYSEKMKAGGVLPYDTPLVIDLDVSERGAKSVQVYLNSEKLISNSNTGIYTLKDNKCQIMVDGSKLVEEEGNRNVFSFILLDSEGKCLTDEKGRIINSYISIIRNSDIEVKKYKVTFNTNGAGRIPEIHVEEGNKLSLPKDPTKGRFVFKGWYTDKELKNKFDANKLITSDITLYALWGVAIPNKPINNGGSIRNGGSSGGSGGGGGGGGGGGVSGGTIPRDAMAGISNMLTPLSGSISNGTWQGMGMSKRYVDSNGEVYKNKWANINDNVGHNNWYKFDANGNMQTGFYAENGKVYYFDIGDRNANDIGKMATGWQLLKHTDGNYYFYYFNEDGIGEARGALLTNGVTKDGCTVDAYGRWVIDGVPQTYSMLHW